jgi:hypothetical protein
MQFPNCELTYRSPGILLALLALSAATLTAQEPRPIFDGRLNLKPTALTAAEQTLLRDRILPAARQAWKTRKECDAGTTGAALDVASGSFTRPKSDQRAILYTYCTVGHNMALNGIAVIEKGVVAAHAIYEGGNDHAIGALPDINGNGLSEILVVSGGTNQGVTWEVISILELGGAVVSRLGQTEAYSDDCGVNEESCTKKANRLSVRAGSLPAFFREVFVDKGAGTWRLSGPRTPISLDRSATQYELVP